LIFAIFWSIINICWTFNEDYFTYYGSRSHFSSFCISRDVSFSHDLLVLFQGCFEAHFWHFYKIFTCHCDLILCKWKIYHFLTHCMFIITNLNVRCIEINIFYNGFWKHGREVALVWTRPSSWIVGIRKCSSNTTKWAF
jgi:hypothetical protein